MRKALSVLVVLGFFAGCAAGEEDEENAMMAYLKAKKTEVRLAMQKCREGRIDELPNTTKNGAFVSIKRALTDTRVATAFSSMDSGGQLLKAELNTTYKCLAESEGVTGVATFGLAAEKADDGSASAPSGGVPTGSSGVSVSAYVPDLGNVSAEAVADSETVVAVLGAAEEGAQGAIKGLEKLAECLADIADCLAHVTLRNSLCIYNAHDLNPYEAFCADGCCSHTSMVGMVHCMPSCGAGWVEEDRFSQCEGVTPTDDGICPWNLFEWFN